MYFLDIVLVIVWEGVRKRKDCYCVIKLIFGNIEIKYGFYFLKVYNLIKKVRYYYWEN